MNGDHQSLEVEVITRGSAESRPIIDKKKVLTPVAGQKHPPYVHTLKTKLSEANKRGLENMVHRGTGPRRSKSYIINQALAQYLGQY